MKTLFIFPPYNTKFSINTGIPQLTGYLKEKGHNVSALDLNIKFYKYLYNDKVLTDLLAETKLLYEKMKTAQASDTFDKANLKHYRFLEKYFADTKLVTRNLKYIKNTEVIVNILKSEQKFKNLFIQQRALTAIEDIQKLLDLIFNDTCTYEDYEYFVEKSPIKTYRNFLSTAVDNILKENYDCIAFSVNGSSQAISSLILSKMLKEEGYTGKISMGGSNIFCDEKYILQDKHLFKGYVDSIIVGQGEYATEEYFEYLAGERNISKVSNLIYTDEKGIIHKNKEKYVSKNDFILPSFDGYDLSEYYLPETIFPIRVSYGCYWGKCVFCAYYYNNPDYFYMRNASDVVNEIKEYINKYNVRNFYFVDSCLPSKFLDDFATRIIAERIEISYAMQNRLEDSITRDLLKKLYKSGLKVCAWGLESASTKILKKMNKGITVESAKRILKDSTEAGIYNVVYWIHGFPGETDDDFDMTYNFLLENRNNIQYCIDSYFMLPLFSYMYFNPEEFDIKKSAIEKAEKERPYHDCVWGSSIGFEISEISKQKIKELKKVYFRKSHVFTGSLETMLLSAKYNDIKFYGIKYKLAEITEKIKYRIKSMKKQDYNIYKDKNPKDTIGLIKSILKKYNITVEEHFLESRFNEVTSVRLTIRGAEEYGTNGKGTNKINALASGYGELLERLQTKFIYKPFLFTSEPDAIVENISNIKAGIFKTKEDPKHLNELLYKIKQILSLKYGRIIDTNYERGKSILVPFVSLKTKETVYLPINEIKFLQGTNGAAAGNTYEEAVVQGLSEICERYSQRRVFENKIKIPTIPSTYYKQYKKIKDLIEYTEANGIKVTIKDASIGKGLPVVCTIFEDERTTNKKYHINFGAHPVLPVAIERTLSEFLQGYNIEDKSENTATEPDDEDAVSRVVKQLFLNHCAFAEDSPHIQNLLSETSDYDFDAGVWCNKTDINNKYLLKKLKEVILNFADDIYVRNYSYLNFPTIYIFIPEISRTESICDYENIFNLIKWVEYSFGENDGNSIESLFRACDFISRKTIDNTLKPSKIFPEYWAFLCAIVLKDKNNIRLYSKKVKKVLKPVSDKPDSGINLKLIEAVTYYYCSEIEDKEVILKEISQKFSEQTCKQLMNFLQMLNFDKIKLLLKNSPDIKTDSDNTEPVKTIKANLTALNNTDMPEQSILTRL